MVASIGSAAWFSPGVATSPTSGLEAQITRYQKHLSECVKYSFENNPTFWLALNGALLCCPPLAVLALRRDGRLVSHPPRTTQNAGLFSNEYLIAHLPKHRREKS